MSSPRLRLRLPPIVWLAIFVAGLAVFLVSAPALLTKKVRGWLPGGARYAVAGGLAFVLFGIAIAAGAEPYIAEDSMEVRQALFGELSVFIVPLALAWFASVVGWMQRWVGAGLCILLGLAWFLKPALAPIQGSFTSETHMFYLGGGVVVMLASIVVAIFASDPQPAQAAAPYPAQPWGAPVPAAAYPGYPGYPPAGGFGGGGYGPPPGGGYGGPPPGGGYGGPGGYGPGGYGGYGGPPAG